MKKGLLTTIGLSAAFLIIGCAYADEQPISPTSSQTQDISNGAISKSSSQSLIEILNKLDDLQNQINDLNGSVSTLKHLQQESSTNLGQQIQSLQQQIDDIGQQLKATPAPKTIAKKANNAPSANALAPALKQIKARNFPTAIKSLKGVIANSTDKDTVTSANYYLTIAYAANAQYKDSIAVGRKFINENPGDQHAPDVMRTIYISQSQLGMKKSAANTANSLITDYPDSNAAKKVKQELDQ